jgi:adenylyltransferase/sulfurtransferase
MLRDELAELLGSLHDFCFFNRHEVPSESGYYSAEQATMKRHEISMDFQRYHRQILLPQIGQNGQEKLAAARVLLVGCGALGSVIAEQLVRGGVGFLRLVDRDIVELTNLQRQGLFDESDVKQALPKAVAAAKRLGAVNSTVRVEPMVADADSGNIERLADVDLILDGTDNVATRYLINDVSVKRKIPWIYGACVGTEGRVMVIRPGRGPCLRCIFPEPPEVGELATCDTAGVLGPVVGLVGSFQSIAAIKLLSGNESAIADEMLMIDAWSNRIRAISTVDAKCADCPTCGFGQFAFLNDSHSKAVQLCGRQAVQIRSAGKIDMDSVQVRLSGAGALQLTPYFVRCELREEKPISLMIFADGRTIVHGTNDPGRARAIHAKYIGN